MIQILFMGFLVFFSAWAGAADCIDFSGQYTAKDKQGSETFLQISQQDCASLALDYDYDHRMRVSRTIILDGLMHVVYSSSELLSYESAQTTKDGISYQGVDEYLRERKKYLTTGKIHFDEQMNLIEEATITDELGQLLKTTSQLYRRK